MYNNPYMMGGNIPQQLAQNRMEQLQNQYNTMFPQQNVMMQNQQPQQTQFLKGRPVSSVEEARASMIDLMERCLFLLILQIIKSTQNRFCLMEQQNLKHMFWKNKNSQL